ncbi:MAG: ABC transporter substrate-binding protein [Chromatiales bacterium]|jgi:NitT/TauT family transport system substrate-binding protein|nr:ABC transporter substrate-binding protein [Chromatiales bacterium]
MGTITLLENLRAVFYAPFYLAIHRDYFAAEGLNLRFLPSSDPGDTLPRLLRGEVDVCWGGPLRVLRAHDEDPNCGLVCFNEVVGRDPFFLAGRGFGEQFSLSDLAGKRLGVVSEVPTPWICLRQDLADAGVALETIDVVEGQTMAANEAAVRAGELDAFQAFQPFVERAARSEGITVLTAAADRGPTSYTTFYTTRAAMELRPEAFAAMAAACQRAVRAVYEEGGTAVQPALEPLFPEQSPELLGAAVDRYINHQLYNRSGAVSREGFEWLKRAMLGTGFINKGAEFDVCVDNSFAAQD